MKTFYGLYVLDQSEGHRIFLEENGKILLFQSANIAKNFAKTHPDFLKKEEFSLEEIEEPQEFCFLEYFE